MKLKSTKVEECMKYLSDFILYDTIGSKGNIMIDIFQLAFPDVAVVFPTFYSVPRMYCCYPKRKIELRCSHDKSMKDREREFIRKERKREKEREQ